MAHPGFTPNEIASLFIDTLGAYAILQSPRTHNTTALREQQINLDEAALNSISKSAHVSVVVALGSACFGAVWERYKRRVGPHTAGSAFNLHRYSIQQNLLADFPSINLSVHNPLVQQLPGIARNGAVVWRPNSTGILSEGHNANNPSWFASTIRNSFAHANWELINPTGGLVTDDTIIVLKNYNPQKQAEPTDPVIVGQTPAGLLTFQLPISLGDLKKLISVALRNLIQYVQQPNLAGGQINPAAADQVLLRLLEAELQGGFELDRFFV
ncbi:hypothetical protein BJ508DRAFT_414758 [Ascobolus immersus RN42]|uniref:Uncharacterized protein n=1 Tax=Ascobolus immersus RN42 TaxID=1160509 RepID=A0A3N4II26_ASCIM|nr:hypothetical protein BJ508DRAFT_414758 [Ascobolus immersus RN42]